MIALVGMAVACEKTPPPPPPAEEEEIPQPEEYVFLADDVPEELTKAEREKVASLGDFSFAFFNTVSSETKGSFVISPVSITYLLGMLAEATEGTARTEILGALGLEGVDLTGLHCFLRDLKVLSAQIKYPESAVMELANVVMTDCRYSVLDAYRKTVKNYYDADVVTYDRLKPVESLQTVNQWASDRTHGLIPKITDKLWDCVLMNALYLKAPWTSEQFNEGQTEKKDFLLENGGTRSVPLMHCRSLYPCRYKDGPSFLLLELSLGLFREFSMFFLLPKEGSTIKQVTTALDYAAWTAAVASMESEFVDILLPKFDVDTDKDLKVPLKSLGIKRLFDNTELTHMIDDFRGEALTLKQLTNISVAEKGVEAAAVSFAGLEGAPAPGEEDKPVYKEFHADHPFMFLIQEKKTGAILFMGCYQ